MVAHAPGDDLRTLLEEEHALSSAPRDDSVKIEEDSPASVGPVDAPVPARVDFALAADGKLLIYGWVLGYSRVIERLSADLNGTVFDLTENSILVCRPDVAQHFSLEAGNDAHGFYALIDLRETVPAVDRFALRVTLCTGETGESYWPVVICAGDLPSSLAPHAATLRKLLPALPRREAKRLVEFASPALGAQAELMAALPPPLQFQLDLCCIVENHILLICGWLLDPLKQLSKVQVCIGNSVSSLLDECIFTPRPDIDLTASPYKLQEVSNRPGFVLIKSVPPNDVHSPEVAFSIALDSETAYLTRPLTRDPEDAKRDFLSLLGKLDADSQVALTERLSEVLSGKHTTPACQALVDVIRRSAVEHLPLSIHHNRNPRYALHLDQAIPIAGRGVFLLGWFHEEMSGAVRVECRCESSTYAVSENWNRTRRADVSSFLSQAGATVADNKHGYVCYVPLTEEGQPYYLAALSPSGEVNRMKVTVAEREDELQTVRALLSCCSQSDGDPRSLMDRHAGPAVSAVWAARSKPVRMPLIRRFGRQPDNPPVTVLVPLYGRHDFAEYQMALFADDPDFQQTELIYVVDDPAIADEFFDRCVLLYEIYRIPFVVAYAGANLGYSGANNFGAEVSRGKRLLLMNSDVLPKRHGWVGDLLRTYDSLPTPGLVGVKLLYEDGTLQHAGISFRERAIWGNLWINHHPSKGLIPNGLSGLRPAAAVTAACAMIDSGLYRELKGFSEDYIIGDFEDSDLCLRAISAGRQNYVALDIDLYHLERQSQNQVGDAEWRTNITLYNCWLHHRRWASFIEQLQARQT